MIVLQCGRHAFLVVQLLVDLILLYVSTFDDAHADFVPRGQRVEQLGSDTQTDQRGPTNDRDESCERTCPLTDMEQCGMVGRNST